MLTEQTVEAFLKQAIDEIKTITPAETWAWQNAKIKRTGTGYKTWDSNRPDFEFGMMIRHAKQPFASIVNFGNQLRTDTRYQKILEKGGNQHYLRPDSIALELIRDYLNRLEKLEFIETITHQVSALFIQSLTDGNFTITCLTILRGVKADFNKHQLTADLCVREPSDEESLKYAYTHWRGIKFHDFLQHPLIVETKFLIPVKPISYDFYIRAGQRFDELVTVLRLLKPEYISWKGVWLQEEGVGKSSGMAFNASEDAFVRPRDYVLKEADLPQVAKLLAGLPKANTCKPLQIAISRVNFAIQRERAEDKILDLLIALEALFGDGAGAIGYKIGMRCAKFTEGGVVDREKTNLLVRDLFEKRHIIVHGGANKIENASVERVRQLHQIVQKSILLFLNELQMNGAIPNAKELDCLLLK